MAITDYASLQASIANWLHRDDLTALIPDFITLAETRMNGDLSARLMDTFAQITCSPGVTSYTLPDFLEIKAIGIAPGVTRPLIYVSQDQIVAETNGDVGVPVLFTVQGQNIGIGPAPDAAYILGILYKAKIPALSDTNTTNWLLTQSPNIYLFGALSAAAAFSRDQEDIALWESAYQSAVDTINKIDWYSGTTMRVRTL